MAGSLGELGGRGVVLGAPGLNEEDEEEEESSLVSRWTHSSVEWWIIKADIWSLLSFHDCLQVLLSVLVQHGQVGLCFYDSGDSSLHYMVDTPDNYDLHLLARGKQQ